MLPISFRGGYGSGLTISKGTEGHWLLGPLPVALVPWKVLLFFNMLWPSVPYNLGCSFKMALKMSALQSPYFQNTKFWEWGSYSKLHLLSSFGSKHQRFISHRISVLWFVFTIVQKSYHCHVGHAYKKITFYLWLSIADFTTHLYFPCLFNGTDVWHCIQITRNIRNKVE